MPNVYEVRMNDGNVYTVTTKRYHDNHDERTFRQHFYDVVSSSISGIVSGVVVGFVHRGRK